MNEQKQIENMRKIFLKTLLRILIFSAVIALAFYLAQAAKENDTVRNLVGTYGYIGIFIISLISGFNFFVPIPAISFLPLFTESGLNYWITLLIITSGMTMADIAVYFLAKIGKEAISESFGAKILNKFKNIHKKHAVLPLAILFVFASVVPLPNEILLIAFSLLNYRFMQIIPVVFAGNFIFNILYAFGIFSLLSIL